MRMPAKGEMVSHPSGLEFRVPDADPRHIRRLRVPRPATEGTPAQVAAEWRSY
jgi:magnesium and cobalt transporter